MKLARHLLAVCVVVGLVVALGFVWAHSGAAGLVADDRGGRAPAGATGTGDAGRVAGERGSDRRGDHGVSLSHVDDLAQTLVVLTVLIGGVIVVDRRRRRRRPSAARAAAGA